MNEDKAIAAAELQEGFWHEVPDDAWEPMDVTADVGPEDYNDREGY